MTGARTLGRDRERLHPFADEAQRFGQRARERAQRAEFADVFLQRRRRPMIERIAARGPVLEEVEHAAHDCLQRNLPSSPQSAPRPPDR